jgi:hypothetical protein
MTRTSSTYDLSDLGIEVVAEAIRRSEQIAAIERGHPAPRPVAWCADELDNWPSAPDRLLAEFRQFLEGLSDERLAELHAIYWLGRDGTGRAECYPSLLRYARDHLEHGASYLMSKPLANGLRRGRELLGLGVDTGPTGGPAPRSDQSDLENR